MNRVTTYQNPVERITSEQEFIDAHLVNRAFANQPSYIIIEFILKEWIKNDKWFVKAAEILDITKQEFSPFDDQYETRYQAKKRLGSYIYREMSKMLPILAMEPYQSLLKYSFEKVDFEDVADKIIDIIDEDL